MMAGIKVKIPGRSNCPRILEKLRDPRGVLLFGAAKKKSMAKKAAPPIGLLFGYYITDRFGDSVSRTLSILTNLSKSRNATRYDL